MLLSICVYLGSAGAAASADTDPAPSVQDSSRILAGGERILEQSVVVSGPVEAVWEAFTTSEGFASWAAPVAKVDFGLGGIIESSYELDGEIGAEGNIKNEILAYAPHRMLAFRTIQAPPATRFDVPTFKRLHTVVFLEEAGPNATRVTITQPGYLQGSLYDGVYRHFEWGNRWSLEQLARRFAEGPTNWADVLREVDQGPEAKESGEQ
jgi:uncharacterized protein YndB with AHSA1/START domain